MDRSILRSPDPNAVAPNGERRRSVRQKLHTPVYASFNRPQTGLVVDLSELLDLHEDGFAVRTSERLEINRAVTLSLDLPETKNYVHGNGQVIWSDDAGRGGIRFSALPEPARRILREWLFANLLVACANHAARTEQLARRDEEKSEEKSPEPALGIATEAVTKTVTTASNVISISDGNGTLASIEAVRREVSKAGSDVDAILTLITESALKLTGASGAALAFLTEGKMICRARTGEPAPPLGALVDVKQGLSGECVRSGLLVSCEDADNDPRVDPELCRTLGIGSLMAAPIGSGPQVVGLLEVFSPHPHNFTKDHETVLERLVEMIPKTGRDSTLPEPPEAPAGGEFTSIGSPAANAEVGAVEPSSMDTSSMYTSSMYKVREPLLHDEPVVREQVSQQPLLPPVLQPEDEPASRFRALHFGLLGLAIIIVAMAVGYVIQPMVAKRLPKSAQQRPSVETVQAASKVSGGTTPGRNSSSPASSGKRATPMSLAELQRRADQGDADAQWLMGERCHSGEEVPQDDLEAVKWFRRAAEQGHVDAQATLGAYYWAGRGVPQDLSKAYFWSTIALAEGDENSKSRLEGLSSQMTQTQVSTARQEAEEWIHSHSQRAKSEAN